ncbi:MAG: transglycosylase SLT domain-containing protein [Alphaproteobacteria bacterium]|nr:transglycosylase SLT domain-containing protein [Alphaproteobacteria bacterium]
MLPAIARFMFMQTVLVSFAVFIMGVASGVIAASPSKTAVQNNICKSAIRQIERTNKLPNMLLHAVSLAETGRWNARSRVSIAWPWTVTAKGKGKFYPDRDTAISAVKRLQRDGVKNIDVGCLQINLMHHKSAFKSLEEAFAPSANARYAAHFLKSLRKRAGSWAHAVGRYHSSNWQGRGRHYWRKVRILWKKERVRDYKDRRAADIKAFQKRRQQIARQYYRQ